MGSVRWRTAIGRPLFFFSQEITIRLIKKDKGVMEDKKLTMPMIALRGLTVLPQMTVNFDIIRDKSIAAVEQDIDRVTAAKAADELLNIMGIDTSFVVAPDGDKVNLSARSMGDTNVQVILDNLGGGSSSSSSYTSSRAQRSSLANTGASGVVVAAGIGVLALVIGATVLVARRRKA